MNAPGVIPGAEAGRPAEGVAVATENSEAVHMVANVAAVVTTTMSTPAQTAGGVVEARAVAGANAAMMMRMRGPTKGGEMTRMIMTRM